MEKIVLVGNFTVDIIHIKHKTYKCIGGPPSYGSLVLRDREDLNVEVLGNYAEPHEKFLNILKSYQISVIGKKCVKYDVFEIFGVKKKKLLIKNLGCKITNISEGDFFVFNGVSNEIRTELIGHAKKLGGTVFVDPQGFIRKRKVGPVNFYNNRDFSEQLKNVDYIKVNNKEIKVITGLSGVSGINELHKMGVKNVLYFSGEKILFDGEKFKIGLEVNKKTYIYDGIGMGDIFNAAFVYGLLKKGVEFALPLAHMATLKRIDRACLLKAPKIEEIIDDAKFLMKDLIIYN